MNLSQRPRTDFFALKERRTNTAAVATDHLYVYRFETGKNLLKIVEISKPLDGDLPRYEPKTAVTHTKRGKSSPAFCRPPGEITVYKKRPLHDPTIDLSKNSTEVQRRKG